MPLYSLGNLIPQLADGAWAAPSADLIGDVRLGARASVWFGAVIRADNTPIVIGDESNIQDGSVCHSDEGFPLTIGARVTVGHKAILHGCTIADDCLIGMGARILNGAVIESGSIVGAARWSPKGRPFRPVASSSALPRALCGRSRKQSWRHYALLPSTMPRKLRDTRL